MEKDGIGSKAHQETANSSWWKDPKPPSSRDQSAAMTVHSKRANSYLGMMGSRQRQSRNQSPGDMDRSSSSSSRRTESPSLCTHGEVSSHSATSNENKSTRSSKPRRPDVQVYVPRQRRLQQENNQQPHNSSPGESVVNVTHKRPVNHSHEKPANCTMDSQAGRLQKNFSHSTEMPNIDSSRNHKQQTSHERCSNNTKPNSESLETTAQQPKQRASKSTSQENIHNIQTACSAETSRRKKHKSGEETSHKKDRKGKGEKRSRSSQSKKRMNATDGLHSEHCVSSVTDSISHTTHTVSEQNLCTVHSQSPAIQQHNISGNSEVTKNLSRTSELIPDASFSDQFMETDISQKTSCLTDQTSESSTICGNDDMGAETEMTGVGQVHGLPASSQPQESLPITHSENAHLTEWKSHHQETLSTSKEQVEGNTDLSGSEIKFSLKYPEPLETKNELLESRMELLESGSEKLETSSDGSYQVHGICTATLGSVDCKHSSNFCDLLTENCSQDQRTAVLTETSKAVDITTDRESKDVLTGVSPVHETVSQMQGNEVSTVKQPSGFDNCYQNSLNNTFNHSVCESANSDSRYEHQSSSLLSMNEFDSKEPCEKRVCVDSGKEMTNTMHLNKTNPVASFSSSCLSTNINDQGNENESAGVISDTLIHRDQSVSQTVSQSDETVAIETGTEHMDCNESNQNQLFKSSHELGLSHTPDEEICADPVEECDVRNLSNTHTGDTSKGDISLSSCVDHAFKSTEIEESESGEPLQNQEILFTSDNDTQLVFTPPRSSECQNSNVDGNVGVVSSKGQIASETGLSTVVSVYDDTNKSDQQDSFEPKIGIITESVPMIKHEDLFSAAGTSERIDDISTVTEDCCDHDDGSTWQPRFESTENSITNESDLRSHTEKDISTSLVQNQVDVTNSSAVADVSCSYPGSARQQQSDVDVAMEIANEEGDEDSWDRLYDDDGEALDSSLIDQLTVAVGKVKVQKPQFNYYNYQPKDPDIDYETYGHVIEIYDFSPELITRDIFVAFKSFSERGFDVKWVDDTHALGIFASTVAAQEALEMNHPLLKVRHLSEASKQSKVKARRCTEFLQPYKERPEMTAAVARNLVTNALGLQNSVPKEKRDLERKLLKEAREKRKQQQKQKRAAWDGSVKGCAMDDPDA